jgi:hypothetical protein
MVTLPELNAFMLLCAHQSRDYKAHEFQRRMAAFAAEELWRGGVHATKAGAAKAGNEGVEPSAPLVAWVASLVRHCNDSDLDLSSSLDASIDFMAIAAAQKPQLASDKPRAQDSASELDGVGVSDEDDDVDEASEEVLGSPAARKPALSIPRLNLGGGTSGTRSAAIPALSLTGVAMKGEEPTAAVATEEWVQRSHDPAAPVVPIVPGELVGMDTVKLLFELLHVADVAGIEFQEFVDLLQQVAEESGTLDLEDESFDNVVPIDVILQFVRDFAGAMDGWMVGYTGEDDAEDEDEDR